MGKEQQQEELSELARVAISEGHVACLRVIIDGCSEQVCKVNVYT